MTEFLHFCRAHEKNVENEEQQMSFSGTQDQLEWKVKYHKTSSELYQKFSGSRKGSSTKDVICRPISLFALYCV